jgi:SAM-dependent methyltransferase
MASSLRYELIHLWGFCSGFRLINVGLLHNGTARAEPVDQQDLQTWNLNVYRAAWTALIGVRPIDPRSRILEIGCGQGLGLQFLAAQYEGRPTGIDMSLVATLIARRTGLTVKRGTSHALPFASASFDVIVVVEALFVFAGWAQALKEIRRVLVPGGHLVTAEFTSLTTYDARDAVARRAHDAQLRLVALVDHTADARRAVLEGEPVRARYLRHVPAPIAACFRDVLSLKGSKRYANWAERRESYYIAVLQAV